MGLSPSESTGQWAGEGDAAKAKRIVVSPTFYEAFVLYMIDTCIVLGPHSVHPDGSYMVGILMKLCHTLQPIYNSASILAEKIYGGI